MMSCESVLRRAGSATEQDLERTVVGWWVEFGTSIKADALWGRYDKMDCHCAGCSWFSILAAFSIEWHLSDICKLWYKKWNVSFVQLGKVWVHRAKLKDEWMNDWVNKLFFFHWRYSPLWALACRTISFHFSLSITNSLHHLTPSTWRSHSTSSFHPFLGLPLCLVPSSSWVKIFLGILPSSILSRWPNQLILCPFIHLLYFLDCSSLLVLNSSYFSIPRFHI